MKPKSKKPEVDSGKCLNKELNNDLLDLCMKYHTVLNPGEMGYECIRFFVGMLRNMATKPDLATKTILAALLDEYEFDFKHKAQDEKV